MAHRNTGMAQGVMCMGKMRIETDCPRCRKILSADYKLNEGIEILCDRCNTRIGIKVSMKQWILGIGETGTLKGWDKKSLDGFMDRLKG